MVLRTFLGGLGGLTLLVVGVQLSAACYDVADTSYGGNGGSGLQRSNIPGEAGTIGASCGTTKLAIDGGGSCPSFEKDIYPLMQTKWQCTTAGCHGGPTAPKMSATSASDTLTALKATKVASLPYLPTAAAANATATSSDPTATSSMLCNLQGACGSKMPKSPGQDLSTSEICLVSAWLSCGTPN